MINGHARPKWAHAGANQIKAAELFRCHQLLMNGHHLLEFNDRSGLQVRKSHHDEVSAWNLLGLKLTHWPANTNKPRQDCLKPYPPFQIFCVHYHWSWIQLQVLSCGAKNAKWDGKINLLWLCQNRLWSTSTHNFSQKLVADTITKWQCVPITQTQFYPIHRLFIFGLTSYELKVQTI